MLSWRKILLALLLIAENAFSQVDERFGFFTPSEPRNALGLAWYYNYTFDPPPPGMNRLYPVGYLYRYREEADRIGIKNDYGSYQVQIDSTGVYLTMNYKADLADPDKIFDYEQPFISAMINDPDSSGKGRYWIVGNEPNMFPYFEPADYVNQYARYYLLIKSLDARAKILPGGLWMTTIENPYETIDGYLHCLIPGLPIRLKYDPIPDEFAWYRQFLSELDQYNDQHQTKVQVDIGNFHIYPHRGLDSVATTITDDTKNKIIALADLLSTEERGQNKEIFITEMGNVNIYFSEEQVAQVCSELVDFLKQQPAITKWFWFMLYGYDPKFSILVNPYDFLKQGLPKWLADLFKNVVRQYDHSPHTALVDLATIYSDINYQGKSAKLFENISNLECACVGSDQISSIAVSPNVRVTLYDHPNYEGKAEIFTASDSDLSDNYIGNDTVSSLKLEILGIVPYNQIGEAYRSAQDLTRVPPASLQSNTTASFALRQNYPNPFNSDTYINYQLPEASLVVIKIYNALGQLIRELVNEQKQAGYYTVRWDGQDNHGNAVGSAIYLFKIHAGNFLCTRKMAMLK